MDYHGNVRRLVLSQTARCESKQAPRGRRTEARLKTGIGRIAEHVVRLYHRRRDPNLLHWLLGASRRGEAERREALMSLWDEHWQGVLEAAGGSAIRCRKIVDMLRHTLRGRGDHMLWHGYLAQLHEAAGGIDSPGKTAALTVLAQLGQFPVMLPAAPLVRRYTRNSRPHGARQADTDGQKADGGPASHIGGLRRSPFCNNE